MTKVCTVGRHFWRLPSPTPSSGRLQQQAGLGCAWWMLLISKDGDFLPSLFNLCQCLTTFTLQKAVSSFSPTLFQFVFIVSCPVAGHHWEQPGSIPFDPHIRYSCSWIRCLLRAEQAQLSQPLLTWHSVIRHRDITENGHRWVFQEFPMFEENVTPFLQGCVCCEKKIFFLVKTRMLLLSFTTEVSP